MPTDWEHRIEETMAAIYGYGGLLARRHIKQFAFETNLRTGERIKGWQAMRKWLRKLRDAGYIYFPTRNQYRWNPIPESIVWLGWRGVLVVARLAGVDIDIPSDPSESDLRSLEIQLRKVHKIRWLRAPRFSQVLHDIIGVDLRLAIEKSITSLPRLAIERWVTESEFRSDWDRVSYQTVGRKNGESRKKSRVYPDGYFVIVDEQAARTGAPPRARYLVEIDNATISESVFGNKVRMFGSYIRSSQFRERFGDNRAFVLCVTTSPKRLKFLMEQTEKTGGPDGKFFLFTTFRDLWIDPLQMEAVRLSQRRGDWPGIEPYQVNVLKAPVWSMVGEPQKISLFPK